MLRFPKSARLLTTAQFDRVFQRRRSRADRSIVVYGCENEVGRARLGLVVSRKCGGSVRRNRWKRCLREAFRQVQDELPQEIDLVVIARPQAEPAVGSLAQSLRTLTAKVAQTLAAEGAPQ